MLLLLLLLPLGAVEAQAAEQGQVPAQAPGVERAQVVAQVLQLVPSAACLKPKVRVGVTVTETAKDEETGKSGQVSMAGVTMMAIGVITLKDLVAKTEMETAMPQLAPE